ncbi:DoxX-like family protein [Seonamhaeicola aphaedonensis]|uniref:DoxX-like protein n=1 Tax=Seonamhaeicola aphaedonensis TaxID=1461338 RepID=A0A3D9HH82_9FLAO|nr:DoxX-like family protein [Seonamhaeicola aphaedonensis]RED48814.1 DoxX-like protein [Seonamhaeicola aphaedonensis]
MISKSRAHKMFNYLIALVWLANGLFCKVLNLVPRHEQVVGRILSHQYSGELIFIIGILEIGMAIWIIGRIKTKLNAITQIVIVMTMNILEFLLVPELLLWGKANILFAMLFVILIYYNEFVLGKKLNQQN